MGELTRELISRLHTPFEHGIEPVYALRLDAAWRVRGSVLTVEDADYSLIGKTIFELAGELSTAGVDVLGISSEVEHYLAVILADGHGGAENAIKAHVELLPVLFVALGQPLSGARDAVPVALAQIVLTTAREEFLDLYGERFGIARPGGMDDPAYAQHIIEEVKRPRSNAYAMRANVRRIMGEEIDIAEPWRFVARWSVSEMDMDKRFYHGDRWAPHLIQLTCKDEIDWAGAEAQVIADRAAGVLFLGSEWQPWARVTELEFDPYTMMHAYTYTSWVWGMIEPVWDFSRFSNHSVARNMRIGWADWYTSIAYLNIQGIDLWASAEHFCRAWATFDEDSVMGNENTAFSGGYYVDAPGAGRIYDDDFAPSDYETGYRLVTVCLWEIEEIPLPVADHVFDPALFVPEGPNLDGPWGIKTTYTEFVARPDIWDGQPRVWNDPGVWNEDTWTYVEMKLIPHHFIRLCTQDPSGATPIFSDEGALSDYYDALVCVDHPFDIEQGTTFIDTTTGLPVTIPPVTGLSDIFGIPQFPEENGDPPTLSAFGRLSDYIHYLS